MLAYLFALALRGGVRPTVVALWFGAETMAAQTWIAALIVGRLRGLRRLDAGAPPAGIGHAATCRTAAPAATASAEPDIDLSPSPIGGGKNRFRRRL